MKERKRAVDKLTKRKRSTIQRLLDYSWWRMVCGEEGGGEHMPFKMVSLVERVQPHKIQNNMKRSNLVRWLSERTSERAIAPVWCTCHSRTYERVYPRVGGCVVVFNKITVNRYLLFQVRKHANYSFCTNIVNEINTILGPSIVSLLFLRLCSVGSGVVRQCDCANPLKLLFTMWPIRSEKKKTLILSNKWCAKNRPPFLQAPQFIN